MGNIATNTLRIGLITRENILEEIVGEFTTAPHARIKLRPAQSAAS